MAGFELDRAKDVIPEKRSKITLQRITFFVAKMDIKKAHDILMELH